MDTLGQLYLEHYSAVERTEVLIGAAMLEEPHSILQVKETDTKDYILYDSFSVKLPQTESRLVVGGGGYEN